MKMLRSAAVFFVLFGAFAASAGAGESSSRVNKVPTDFLGFQRLIMAVGQGCVQLLAEPALHAVVEDHSNKSLPILDAEGKIFQVVQLGKRMGQGMYGAVYRTQGVLPESLFFTPRSHPDLPALDAHILSETPMTAKLPHSLKEFEGMGPMLHAKSAPIRELENYRFLLSQISKMESDDDYPKDPAWKKGRLMVVPIVGESNTPSGKVLYKPLVQGLFLKNIGEVVQQNSGQLPEEMREGLHDIYNLVQAIYSQVTYGKVPYSVDIRPPNLVWVEKKEMLDLMGMTRPGFALFEIDRMPGDLPAFIKGMMSFEGYEALFLDYARRAWKKEHDVSPQLDP